ASTTQRGARHEQGPGQEEGSQEEAGEDAEGEARGEEGEEGRPLSRLFRALLKPRTCSCSCGSGFSRELFPFQARCEKLAAEAAPTRVASRPRNCTTASSTPRDRAPSPGACARTPRAPAARRTAGA